MIAFIDDHREAHGVEPIRKVLPTARRPEAALAHAHGPIGELRKGRYGWQPCRDLVERGCGG